MFEVKSVTVDNGGKIKTEYELYLNGLLIGTSKLHCDAVLLGKQLDRELKLAYHQGCKTLERMIVAQELELEMQTREMEAKAEYARRTLEEMDRRNGETK